MATRDDLAAADSLIQKLGPLHAAPGVAQTILMLTRDADFDVRDVVECIESDPALAARLLQVVNASRFGCAQRVTGIRQAVAYLGQRSLRQIVLTFSLCEALTRGSSGRLYLDFWRRSLTRATIATRLARLGKEAAADDAFTAGLLADLGLLVLAQSSPDEYSAIYTQHVHGPELVAAERDLFRVGHPALAAQLLVRWKLPDELVTAVRDHHEEIAEPPLALIIRTADLMADAVWTPGTPYLSTARRLLEEHFDLDIDGMIELAVESQKDVEMSCELFGLGDLGAFDCQHLLLAAREQQERASLEACLELESLESVFEEKALSAPTAQTWPHWPRSI